jgi:hypothetical protein
MLFPALLTPVYMFPIISSNASYPALPSGTLGRSVNLPAHAKDPITNPNQPWHPGSTTVFTKFWVVGNWPYAFMKYVGSIPSIDI